MTNPPIQAKTYRQSTAVQFASGTYILLLTPICIVFWDAYQKGQLNDPLQFALLVLMFFPFYVVAWVMLWRFNGRFHLTNDAIILKQLGRTTEIAYTDIINMEEHSQLGAPYLRLRTHQNKTLIILFQTEHFSDLYVTLKKHVTIVQQAENVAFPLHLQLPANYYWKSLVLISLALLFFGLLAAGLVNQEAHLTVWHGLGFMGLFILVVFFVAYESEGKPPTAVIFSDMSVQTQYLFGKPKEWSAKEIRRITRERQERYYKGTTHVTHPLVITFQDGQKFQLDENRIWLFGYVPDRLFAILAQHYPSQPTANGLIAQANSFYEAGDLETAVPLYQQAINIYPAYMSYKLVVGDALFALKRPSDALVAYQELVEFMPEHDQGWTGVGRCQMLLGDLSAAADAFTKAIRLNPEDAVAHYNLAMVQAKQNKRTAARASLNRALALRPEWQAHVQQDAFLREILL